MATLDGSKLGNDDVSEVPFEVAHAAVGILRFAWVCVRERARMAVRGWQE